MNIFKIYRHITHILEQKTYSVFALTIRLMVGYVFIISGWLKFGYVLNDQLDTLYFLFEEYNVPFLSVQNAAFLGMASELIFSVLLILGLFSRFAAIGLIGVSGMVYYVDYNPAALFWILSLGVIILYNGGKISLDNLIKKYI